MRIIAGTFKGRVLHTFSGRGIRPTSDRLRETLFDILQQEIAGATVWDAFAGTGALGLEAISRGARTVVFTEESGRAFRLLQKNVCLLNAADASRLLQMDALAFAAGCRESFDLVFLDPPYDFPRYLDLALTIGRQEVCRPAGQIVLEHQRRSAHAARLLERFPARRQVRQGDSLLSFFSGEEIIRRSRESAAAGASQ